MSIAIEKVSDEKLGSILELFKEILCGSIDVTRTQLSQFFLPLSRKFLYDVEKERNLEINSFKKA